jgi:hypothetical protein
MSPALRCAVRRSRQVIARSPWWARNACFRQDHAGRVATSVRRNQWSSAEIYPKPSGASFTVNGEQVDMLGSLAIDSRRSRDGNVTIPRSGHCIGTRHAPDQHGGRRRRVRGPATDLRRRADPIVLDLLVLQRHPACARGRFPGVWMVRLRAVQVGLWWR